MAGLQTWVLAKQVSVSRDMMRIEEDRQRRDGAVIRADLLRSSKITLSHLSLDGDSPPDQHAPRAYLVVHNDGNAGDLLRFFQIVGHRHDGKFFVDEDVDVTVMHGAQIVERGLVDMPPRSTAVLDIQGSHNWNWDGVTRYEIRATCGSGVQRLVDSAFDYYGQPAANRTPSERMWP